MIFDDGVLIDLEVCFWYGSTIESLNNGSIRVVKKPLIPERVINKFRAVESKARHFVDINSFKFTISNSRYIPQARLPKVIKMLEKYKKEYDNLTENLIINYDKYKTEMHPVHIEIASELYVPDSTHPESNGAKKEKFIAEFMDKINSYYPSIEILKDKFSLDWDIYEISVAKIAPKEYRKKTQERITTFIRSAAINLRVETQLVCNRIINNIDEGKPAKGRTLKALREFIEWFTDLNFVDDTILHQKLKTLLKEFLDHHGNEAISNSDELQKQLSEHLSSLSEYIKCHPDYDNIVNNYLHKGDTHV